MLNWIVRHFILFSSLLLAAAGAWIFLSAPPAGAVTAGKIPAPREGFLAPDFSLQTTLGETIQLNQLRGKVVVLNLWATWCPPCQAEMPAMQKVHEDYSGQPVIILAANMTYQDDPARAASYASEKGLTFPVVLDPQGILAEKYALRALPTTFFIDQSGMIRKMAAGGPLPEALFRSQIELLLQEKR